MQATKAALGAEHGQYAFVKRNHDELAAHYSRAKSGYTQRRKFIEEVRVSRGAFAYSSSAVVARPLAACARQCCPQVMLHKPVPVRPRAQLHPASLELQRLAQNFRERLAKVGHRGDLTFVHGGDQGLKEIEADYGELHVTMTPDAMNRGLTQEDATHSTSVAGLSGGEKSFASLVLLAAIASVADVPWRIADEFDVFQDEKTRERSMRFLLMDATIPSRDGFWPQRILLTPHDVAAALKSKEAAAVAPIAVKKLANPKR